MKNARVLVLSSNRGLCGGYNASVLRAAMPKIHDLKSSVGNVAVDVSGKRGVDGLHYRGVEADERHLNFEDQPKYDEVEKIADSYLSRYVTGELDRLDVVYTKFVSTAKQVATVETLLPLGSLGDVDDASDSQMNVQYEFLPSAESILEEVVPTSFKFACSSVSSILQSASRWLG